MNLILVRHGETDWNTERRWQGQLDVPLNGKGQWQARRVAQALADRPITRLISSDLQRALVTAESIAAACGRPVKTDPRLREMGFGAWEGLTYNEIMESDADSYSLWKENPFLHAPSGAETLDVAGRRIIHAWQEIEREYADTVVLVSHGGTLRVLLCHLLGLPPEAFWQLKLYNASISTVQISPAGNTLISLNDTDHLQTEEEGDEFN